ncbi:MAG: hypothetical protein RL032_1414 [Pseudomonadota bacterium]|jgi:hypothetical protein
MKSNSGQPLPTHTGKQPTGMADLIQAEFLFSRIPAHIRDLLPPEHRQEVLNAFLRMALERNSPIKFETVFPFFFRRYYMAVWLGRDRRKSTVATERARRELVPLPIRTFFYLALLWVVLVCFGLLAFMCLYWFKTFLGIDIFPDHHLKDFVEMFVEWIS